MKRLLLVTDRDYPAAGRDYGSEDVLLADRLRAAFRVLPCDPRVAADHLEDADVVLIRNSGPVLGYPREWAEFRRRASGHRVVNPLNGRGDQQGKGYLLELFALGFPVIPTVDRHEDLYQLGPLGPVASYVVKPVHGADSIGLTFTDDVSGLDLQGLLVQPRLDLVAEESYVFLGREFVYATRASGNRWDLEELEPSAADVAFAQRFVDWNTLDVGITRVDAARTSEGELLLVELEDLNPYLSLESLAPATLDRFVDGLIRSLL